MAEICPDKRLFQQTAGALFWGLFIILTPIAIVLLGALVWIPIFVWRERVRARRYGFWPGALCRYSFIALLVVLAAIAPLKFEDKKVGPLQSTDMTLSELVAAGVIYPLRYQEHEKVRVSLPSPSPSRREVIAAITQQTAFKADVYHCGNVANILFGGGGGRIRVAEPELSGYKSN